MEKQRKNLKQENEKKKQRIRFGYGINKGVTFLLFTSTHAFAFSISLTYFLLSPPPVVLIISSFLFFHSPSLSFLSCTHTQSCLPFTTSNLCVCGLPKGGAAFRTTASCWLSPRYVMCTLTPPAPAAQPSHLHDPLASSSFPTFHSPARPRCTQTMHSSARLCELKFGSTYILSFIMAPITRYRQQC